MPVPSAPPEAIDSEWALSQQYLFESGADLSWVAEQKKWVRWTVNGWRDDTAGLCLSEVSTIGAEKWVRKTAHGFSPSPTVGGRASTARGALALASPHVATSVSQWDADPELVGLPHATVVNLRTSEIRGMLRDDRIIRNAPCVPNFNVPPDCRWRQFIEEALPDEFTREYVMRLAGYSLTGYAREHVIPFLYGPKRMGKSTLFNAIREAMGDYATVSLASNYQRGGHVHRTFYAKLAGVRAVYLTEIPRGFQLDEGLVKSMTGGEPLEANYMRGNPFTFQPQFSLWLIGNNAPTMSERDGGLLARIKVIEFKTPPEYMDVELPNILMKGEEQRYVLADLVTAAHQYLHAGLGEASDAVLAAGEEYANRADTLSMFLSECVDPAPWDYVITRAELFKAYRKWVDDAHQPKPYGKTGFLRALREGDYRVGDQPFKEDKVGGVDVFPGAEVKVQWTV